MGFIRSWDCPGPPAVHKQCACLTLASRSSWLAGDSEPRVWTSRGHLTWCTWWRSGYPRARWSRTTLCRPAGSMKDLRSAHPGCNGQSRPGYGKFILGASLGLVSLLFRSCCFVRPHWRPGRSRDMNCDRDGWASPSSQSTGRNWFFGTCLVAAPALNTWINGPKVSISLSNCKI